MSATQKTPEQELAIARGLIRKQQKALRDLSDTLLIALSDFDAMLESRRDIPRDLSSSLAKWANVLDAANDSVRFFALGVDYRKDDKSKVAAKARKRFGGAA